MKNKKIQNQFFTGGKKSKKAFAMSFTWLFGIIIGMFILFLAIYLVTKFIDQGDTIQSAKASKEIGILLNPLETGFESSKTSSFSMPVETRINNNCNDFGVFGRQLISVSQKSFGEWTDTDMEVGFSNKYIFSDRQIEGKLFYVFSKPFEFPFKVADLIYMTSSEKNYCFSDAPLKIEKELNQLGQENLFTEEFPQECIQVCFSGSCGTEGIRVNYAAGFVQKQGEKVYFEEDSLMFAAIFSDVRIYECQVRRLISKVKELSKLYEDKSRTISTSNCNSNLNLIGLSNMAETFEDSADLIGIYNEVETMQMQNNLAECKLW